jgi:putative FmdB family regulatory protein
VPTYEYLCEGCGHRFDEFQSFKEDPLRICPQCCEDKLRRLFGTGAAILFKGSGFYETDYRSEGYKKAAKADQDAGKPASTDKNGSTGTSSSETPRTETKSTPTTP